MKRFRRCQERGSIGELYFEFDAVAFVLIGNLLNKSERFFKMAYRFTDGRSLARAARPANNRYRFCDLLGSAQ